MTWDHIIALYEADRLSALRKLPELRNKHIYLKPYSKMRVNLVMSVWLGGRQKNKNKKVTQKIKRVVPTP